MRKGEKVKQDLKTLRQAIEHVSKIMETFKCPICGNNDWFVDDQVRFLMHYNLDENDNLNTSKYNGRSVIAVHCKTCGNTMMFNLSIVSNFYSSNEGSVISQAEVNEDNYQPSLTPAQEVQLKNAIKKSEKQTENFKKWEEIEDEITKLLDKDTPMTDETRKKIDALREEQKKYN